MAINKAMKQVLKALSYNDIEVESSRALAALKKLDPLKPFYLKLDTQVQNGAHAVPVRIFFPRQAVPTEPDTGVLSEPAFLFLHGGGWVTDSVDNYERICAKLAEATGNIVIAVEYRLAPEHPFPAGLGDCYAVYQAILEQRFLLPVDFSKMTLIGDSAGGNLAAALSLLARDRKTTVPARQILIYPALYNDYSEQSPYPSVVTNGRDYLLTRGKMADYIKLYARHPEDMNSSYFAPLLADDLSRQPRTLIITAEFDPLRDEGEDYARRLKAAGNQAEVYRLPDALHGFFALGITYLHVKESFRLINRFLKKSGEE